MAKQHKQFQLIIPIILVLSYQSPTVAQIPKMPEITINPPTPIFTFKESTTVKRSRKRPRNRLLRIPFTNYAYPTIKINNETYVIFEDGIRSNCSSCSRSRSRSR
ncbi:hypothetical protein NIES4071_108480 (plasmid) [Calothrix sp. NIES-4071]|nr:hypothetical protein NIES4071_108480 [Calothrix sp. NIES-4071]BAZ65140.1 hypothetical protein NIES4105_108730 [Calothrix sp. NIES-4105]